MSAINIQFPALYTKQNRAFFTDARISACEASTKAGKSVAGLTWIQTQGINNPGNSYLWLAPVYSLAKVMFERVVRMWTRMDPDHATGWDVNRSDLVFTLPGGSRIFFMGADRPDLIYGRDYAGAVIDEASRCKEEAWHAVRSTTTSTRGKIRLIGNVKGRKNWFYRIARKAEAGNDSSLHYERITWEDAVAAGVIEREEILEAKKVLPDHVFRELYSAEAASDSGSPFEGIEECIGPMSNLDPVVWGWDVARDVDYTAGIALDRNGAVCRFEHWQRPWDETIQIIAGTNCANYVDETGLGKPVVELIQRRHGNTRGVIFSAQSKQAMMQSLAVAIKSRQIQFPRGPISQELESFEYAYTATGIRYEAPSGEHDDCVCALALAVSGFVFGPREAKPADIGAPDADAWLPSWA